MSWVKLDDQFFANQKVIDLPKDAKLLYLAGLTHCAAQLTDGLITLGGLRLIAAMVDADRSLAAALVDAGLWERDADGYVVHDDHKYNPSAEQVKAERERNLRRQQDFQDRKVASRNAVINGVNNAVNNAVINSVSNAVNHGVNNSAPYPYPNSISINKREGNNTARVHAPAKPTHSDDEILALILTPALRSWAVQNAPGIDVQAAANDFVDYLREHNEQRNDYPAAFRRWLRREPRFRPNQQTPDPPPQLGMNAEETRAYTATLKPRPPNGRAEPAPP
jgi:hypothetical protein